MSVPEPSADPQIPPRSRLVSLQPCGLGTPFVEGLPSYLLRLAAVHTLDPGPLAELLIAPVTMAGRSSDAGFRARFIDTGHALAGTESAAQAWSLRIGELTGRNDIGAVTLVGLGTLVPHRGLLRSGAVCPPCLEEARSGDGPVHEPLAWSIRAVTVCLRHGIRLETSCRSCGGELRALGWRARVGRCRRCGAWLGADAERLGEPDPFERWAAEQVGRILAWSSSASASTTADLTTSSAASCPGSCSSSISSRSSHSSSCSSSSSPSPRRLATRESFAAALDACISSAGTQNGVAARLGMSKGTLAWWRRGEVRPELRQLLALAALADRDPLALLFGGVEPIADAPPAPWLASPRSAIEWDRVTSGLEHELARRPVRPLRVVAADLGVHWQTLVKHYPAETAMIRSRHERSVHQRARRRRDRLVRRLRSSIESLRQADLPLSRRAVEERSGVILREASMRDAWHAESAGMSDLLAGSPGRRLGCE